MHTYTLYDSAFTHKNPNMSPVNHLRCDLTLCKESKELLTDTTIVQNIDKFPTKLHCVLTEMPEISFNSEWDKGATTHLFVPITNFLKDHALGKAIELMAYDNFIPIVQTNEYSQQVMKESHTASLKLKFTIYTDTYNKRYNFTSSPYETWLKMLYFSTAPLYRATYNNIFNNVQAALTNTVEHLDDVVDLASTVKDGAAVMWNQLPFVEKDPNEAAKLYNVAAKIKELSTMITEYISKSQIIGQICWDVAIPNYLHATNNTYSPILWNVETFNVKFSEKFTRGLLGKSAESFRPRPLYADFEVTLTTNQKMTRDQYIKMLFGNMYDKLVYKKELPENQAKAAD